MHRQPPTGSPLRRYGVGDLERLCRFYLDCVEAEDLRSLRLKSDQRGRLYACPWAEEEPFFHGATVEVVLGAATGRDGEFLKRGEAQAGPEHLFYGYPVYLDDEAYLSPLFFVEVTAQPARGLGRGPAQYKLRLSDSRDVRVNHHVFARNGLRVEQLAAVCDELEGEFGSFDKRLGRAFELLGTPKPDWRGRAELLPPGAVWEKERWYGTPILFRSAYTAFTYHLRRELGDFVRYRSLLENAPATALGPLLGVVPTKAPSRTPAPRVVPVLDLNSSQLEAVRDALVEPLTVVTGPPGTGKSQVVVNLLASLALQGRPVLFASKNNRAVDVVRERLRLLLGEDHDWTLRLGSQEHIADTEAEMLERIGRLTAETLPAPASDDELREVEAAVRGVAARLEAVRDQLQKCAMVKAAEAKAEAALPAEWVPEGEPSLPASFAPELQACRALASGRGLSLLDSILRALLSARYRRAWAARLAALCPTLPGPAAAEVSSRLAELGGLPSWSDLLRLVEGLEHYQAWVQARGRAGAEIERLADLEDASSLRARMAKVQGRQSKIAGRFFRRAWAERILGRAPAVRVLLRRYFDLAERVRSVKGRESWHAVRREWEETARALLPDLPVWVVTNLSARRSLPLVAGLFDLVVIDEASQCDVPSALPLLYRARRAVVIGDPYQLRHISTLRKTEEEAIAARHDCSDLVTDWSYVSRSLFDAAELAVVRDGRRAIFLSEHYRSHPDIIEFSNREFYGRRLVLRTDLGPLTARASGMPIGVFWHDVDGRVTGSAHSAHNPAEMEAVLVELRRWVAAGLASREASVGIVTPFRLQMERIEQALQSEPWWPDLRGRVTVGTAHRFQGDERDIMLFSPVVAPGIRESAAQWVAQTEQLLNVAVTRARAALHIFGHQAACLEAGGVLGRLVSYALAPVRQASRPGLHQSEAEELVAGMLEASGMWFWPQLEVDRYRLDFAVVSPFGTRYDVEVDGRQHLTPEGLGADAVRDAAVRALGYQVLRVRAKDVLNGIHGVPQRLARLV